MSTRFRLFVLGLLAVAISEAGCAPAVPTRSPPTSPLSKRAAEPRPAEVASSLTRDPLTTAPKEADSGSKPEGHEEHGQHVHH